MNYLAIHVIKLAYIYGLVVQQYSKSVMFALCHLGAFPMHPCSCTSISANGFIPDSGSKNSSTPLLQKDLFGTFRIAGQIFYLEN